jgi:hypothetical protein
VRIKLTDRFVVNVKPPEHGRLEFTDTLECGLALRVTANDARSWDQRIWTGPAEARYQRRILLGHPRERDGQPVLSLAQAREASRSIKLAAAEGRPLVIGEGLKAQRDRIATKSAAGQWTAVCNLYRHYDHSGELLYVGISLDALGRQRAHFRGADWRTKIARIHVEPFATREEALAAELVAIQDEFPVHNQRDNDHRLAAPHRGPDRMVTRTLR